MVDTTPLKTAMPNWELQRRIFCVKWYFKCASFKKNKEQFGAFFVLDKAPEKPIIQRWVKKFETFGTVGNLNSKSVNHTTGRYRESVKQSPKRSLRKRCQSLDLSFETCRRVIVEDL